MFNELSNFILHCVIQLSPEGGRGEYWWIFRFTEAYQNSRNNNLYSKFHFSKRYKPTKAEHRNEFNIFQQEKRVYMASVYIIEVHEIIYNIHSNITPHFELIIYKFI